MVKPSQIYVERDSSKMMFQEIDHVESTKVRINPFRGNLPLLALILFPSSFGLVLLCSCLSFVLVYDHVRLTPLVVCCMLSMQSLMHSLSEGGAAQPCRPPMMIIMTIKMEPFYPLERWG